jgi:hypothetical protein
MNMIPSTPEAPAMPAPALTPARAYARFESYVLNVLGDGNPTCDTDSPIEGIELDDQARSLYEAYLCAVNAKNGH